MVKKCLLLLFFSLAISQFTFSQFIGANFNEGTADINMELVKLAGVPYVRGFVNVPKSFIEFDSNGIAIGVTTQADNYEGVDPLIAAKNITVDGTPIKIAYSLKTQFKHIVNNNEVGVPLANSAAEAYYFEAIKRFLIAKDFGANLSILCLGNEPMWETSNSQAAEYKVFLNKLINKAAEWRTQYGWTYDIYIGSLNRSAELSNNPILVNIINLLKTNPNVDGIDLHIHATELNEFEDAFKLIRVTHGITNKKIICTEYSLNSLFGKHRNDVLGNWGVQNGYASTMKMYEWLNDCKDRVVAGNPISRDVFKSYFFQTSWYPQNWFVDVYNTMKDYNVTGALYRLQSEIENPPKYLDSDSEMWLLNPIYPADLLGYDNVGNYITSPLHHEGYREIVGYPVVAVSPSPRIKVAFHETYGNSGTNVTLFPASGTTVSNYSDFSQSDVVNFGAKNSIQIITPPTPSNIQGASGGSCLYFAGASKEVDYIIKGINTNDLVSPKLSINVNKPITPNALISAYFSMDDGLNWEIIYGTGTVSNSDGWKVMNTTTTLPKTNNLWIKFHTSSQHTLLDDVKILSIDQSNLSIDEKKITKGRVICYPNPVSNVLYINAEGTVNVRIFSLSGQLVLQTVEKIINVSGLKKGIYLLEVNGKDGIDIKKIKVE